MKPNDVLALGNALMDFLIEVEDSKLLEFNLKKGEMHLVEKEKAEEILKKIEEHKLKIERVPGGSSANTLRGIAFLGGKVILWGKVGNDMHGAYYIEEMEKQGVKTKISKHYKKMTGHALTFITPDRQRTFSVHLGAAVHLNEEDILKGDIEGDIEEDIAQSKILHIEGYQLEGETREMVLKAMEAAQKKGTLVSLDVADPALIKRNKKLLQRAIADYVDILFANEAEAKEFTGREAEEAVQELGRKVKIAVVKLGENGSLICSEGIITYVNSFPAKVIDTTGAGDSFAAGFLYGCCQGWDIEKAGKLGSLLASKVVERIGVRMEGLDAGEIKSIII